MHFDNVVIVEDDYRNYYPISLSTPLSDIVIGGLRYYEHVVLWLMSLGIDATIYVVTREYLARYWSGITKSLLDELGFKYSIKYVHSVEELSGPSLIIHTSLVPRIDVLNRIVNANVGTEVMCEDKVLLNLVSDSTVNNVVYDCNMPILNGIWSVVKWNTDLLRENIKYLINLLGDKVIDSELSNGAIIDERAGAVVVVKSLIEPLAYIRGPVLLGPGSRVLPHAYVREGTVLYMYNVVGGEVKNSIMDMYSLKEHFSYLGDSYVGRWVNMGAGSVTSNLKNTIGTIRYAGIDTGMIKLGSIMSDWVKVGINTSIMGGRYVGQGSSVLGMVRNNVPPFRMCINDDCKEYRLDKVIEVYRRFSGLRNMPINESEVELIRAVFEESLHETPL